MSKNNYMGKIDEDWSGTTIPNYDLIRTPQQVLQNALDDFEIIFPKGGLTGRSRDLCCGSDNCNDNCDEIKRTLILSWHTTTITAFIKAEIERLEGEKETNPSGYKLCAKCGGVHCGGFEWNTALESQITHLKGLKIKDR